MKYISRIHQFFPKELLIKLNNICDDVLISDNNTKVDKMVQLFDEYNLPYSELGPGTNRFAIMIDGYVFKIAMDRDGVRDNLAEFSMATELQPFVTKIYECNGLIVVAEYVTVISKEEFQRSKEELNQILVHLSQGYLLGDVGTITKNFMNWGYRPDGTLVILDFAYIYRVVGEEMLCDNILNDGNVCGAMLEYDENYNKLICPRCRRKYIFHEIRRRINKNYEMKELETIKQIAIKLTTPELNIKDTTQLREISNKNEGDKDMKQRDFYDDEYITDEEAVDSYQAAMQAILDMKKSTSDSTEDKSCGISGIPHFIPKEYVDESEDDDAEDFDSVEALMEELSHRESDDCDDDDDVWESDPEDEMIDAIASPDVDECSKQMNDIRDSLYNAAGLPQELFTGCSKDDDSVQSSDIQSYDESDSTMSISNDGAENIDESIGDICPPTCDECDDFDCKNTPDGDDEYDECEVDLDLDEFEEDRVADEAPGSKTLYISDKEQESIEEIDDDEAEEIREEIIDDASDMVEDSETGSVITYEAEEEISETCAPVEDSKDHFKADDVLILSSASDEDIKNMRNELMEDINIEDSVDDEYDELYEENFRINQGYKHNQRVKRDKQ